MKLQQNNFAYIDGANLHKGVEDLGWKLEFRKNKKEKAPGADKTAQGSSSW